MPKPPCPRIQVAGIHDIDEARLVIQGGADCIGFPLRLPVHSEDCTEAEAAAIIRAVSGQVQTMCITYLTHAEEILELCDALGVTGIQLHAPIPVAELGKVAAARPNLFIIKSIIIPPALDTGRQTELEQQLHSYAPVCDAFLTDTHDPETGADGATGKTHDWSLSKRLVGMSPRPVILAGGLHPGNVAQAIRAVRPFGVDAHTGLEDANGRKNSKLVAEFAQTAHKELLLS